MPRTELQLDRTDTAPPGPRRRGGRQTEAARIDAPAERVLLDAGRFTVVSQRVSGDGSEREVVFLRHGGAVAVAAVFPNGDLLLVRQERQALGRGVETLELPAGHVKETDPTLEAAARRELLEETGVSVAGLDFLDSGPLAPSLTDGLVHIYWTRLREADWARSASGGCLRRVRRPLRAVLERGEGTDIMTRYAALFVAGLVEVRP